MWGALIAAGASILGNVLQRNAQEAAYERQQRQLDASRAQSNAHYMRQYYTDGTQRADTQRALTQARQNLLRANMAASGRNAVMGGTNATAAAAKQVSSEAYANVVASAAANAEARKDRIDQQHQAELKTLDNQQMTLDATNDQANANAIGNAANQIGGLAQSAIAANNAADMAATRAGVGGGSVGYNAGNTGVNGGSGNATLGSTLMGNAPIQANPVFDNGAVGALAQKPLTSGLTDKVNGFYGVSGKWSFLNK